MTSEDRDWTVPAPLRALLWWPPVAFVVALLDPHAAARTIAVAGAVLAVVGVLVATVGTVVARRLAERRADPTAAPVPLLSAEPASLSVEQQAA